MPDALSPSPPATGQRTVVLAIAAFSICSIAAAIRSTGFLESDGATHYLYARHAFEQPYYLVDVWGRPLFTLIMAIPARLGLIAVRITSLVIAIGCALVAYFLARGQEYRHPALAAIFTLGMPLVFLHSFSELTELPFALLIGAALLAYQRKRFALMAALAALTPLARPEGFGFLILAAVALCAHRRFLALPWLPVGIVAWSIAGHILAGPRDLPWYEWLIRNWPYDANSSYPRGNPFHFMLMLPMLVGPFAFPAMWIGMWRGLRIPLAEVRRDQCRRVQWLIAVIPLGVLLVHTALYTLGKMSSDGELRYLLVVAPLWGLLSAAGWEWIFQQMRWLHPARWAALAVVSAGYVNYAWRVLPLEPPPDWLEAKRVAAWYECADVHLKFPRILCNHPGIYYYLDISPTDRARVIPWSKEDAAQTAPGALLLWDPEFCVRNASGKFIVTLPEAIGEGWVYDWKADILSNVNNPPPWANPKIFDPPPPPSDSSLPAAPMLWHIFRSPFDIDGRATPAVVRMDKSAKWREMPGNPSGSR